MPQFECSSCRGDFCGDCATDMQSCKVCSIKLSKFKVPGPSHIGHFVPGAGS